MRFPSENGFSKLSRQTIVDEWAKRSYFLNVVSAVTSLELLAKTSEGPSKDNALAAVKHLLRPLMNRQVEWLKAKFECRKQALSYMDLSRPNAQKLLYSTMWCGDLFDPVELDAAKKVAEKRCETLVTLLGYKKPGDSKKRKAEEGGSSTVLDKRPSQKQQKKSYSAWHNKPSASRPNTSSQFATPSAPASQKKAHKPQQKSKSKNSAKGGKQNV